MPIGKAIARNFFKALAGKGIGPTALIRLADNIGGSYRKQDMLADIRRFEGRVLHETQIVKMTGNQVVPKAYMVETELNGDYKYRVLGKQYYYDEETGLEYPETRSFYTNDLAKIEHYEQEYMEKKPWDDTDPTSQVLSFQVTGIEHNEGWSY